MSAAMKLDACPFCGGNNLHFSSSGMEINFVTCEDCGAEGPANTNDSKAAISWNRRPPQDELSALPELPKAERELIELHQPTTYTTHVCTSARYSADQMRAYGLLCRQSGDAADKRDAERLDHMESWNKKNAERGLHWNTWAFDVKTTIREQLDAAIAQRPEGGA